MSAVSTLSGFSPPARGPIPPCIRSAADAARDAGDAGERARLRARSCPLLSCPPFPSAMHLPARARRAAGAARLCAGVPAPAGSAAATPGYAATRGWRSAPCRKIALMNSTPAAMTGGRKTSRRCPPRSLRNAKHRVLPLGAARARRARRAWCVPLLTTARSRYAA